VSSPVGQGGTAVGGERVRPLVSAVVTTRNRANLLREALESVLHQQGAGDDYELELIVVDVASTDTTPDVVSAYPVTRYIRLPERRRSGTARNAGAAASRGQYVAFLDDDDLWLPDKLQLQVPALEAHPEAGAVYSRVVVRSEGGEWIQPGGASPPSGAIFEALLRTNVCGGVLRFLIRRAALDVVGLFDETLPRAEDYDLWLRLAYRFPILFVPGQVGVYRPAPDGNRATTLTAGLDPKVVRYVAEKALALLPDTPGHASLRRQARAWAEARVATQLAAARDADAVWSEMIEAVRRSPVILAEPAVRDSLVSTARRCVRTFDSPSSRARAASADLRVAAHTAGRRHALRRVQAAIWADAATDLLRATPRDWRGWSSAVARAVSYDPGHAIRRALKGLRRFLRSSRKRLRFGPPRSGQQ
jgi:glycosyltransferase involved in cell wall biosynthesis